jgi:phospho-N-acetylmuramoyl-pentapeptide-transferase
LKIFGILVIVFFLQILFLSGWISRLNAWRVVQIQKIYGPESHIRSKSSTPSMGGIVFLAVSILSIPLIVFLSESLPGDLVLFWIFPFGAASIGFIDDWIKFTKKSSEGFPSLYKLVAQILLVVPWAYWVALSRGIFLWPGFAAPVLFSAPLLAFLAIGMMNAVNVTDGLDGLAAGASLLSLLGAIVWLRLNDGLLYIALAGVAMCAGFLWYNAHPAKIFMGDVGSHFLAGILLSLCVYADFLVAVFPLGFLFGLEILSVAIQLVAIHFFKRKVFRMSPFHHHFELLGWGETQIVTRFWMVHGAGLTFLALAVNGLLGA